MSATDAVDGSSTGRASALESVAGEATKFPEELIMLAITTIGLDIAKSIFQVHGVDALGNVVVRRQLKRRYVLAFFKKLPSAWSASRPARRRIIGRASFRLSVIPCASSLRPT